jgi:REP element-mobilizing transposase RayT
MSYLQCKDSALFVYLAWGTRPGQSALACDEIRQAAYLAIITRIRSQFCHVLAIGGTTEQIHLIARFPASLSVSTVVRMAQEAGGRAIAHQAQTFQGRLIAPEKLWETICITRTLPPVDAAEARAYLRQQIAAEEASRDRK